MAEIDELSAIPLWLTAVRNQEEVAHATGFVVRHADTNFLFTNWHVVTGKNAETGAQQVSEPDHLTVWHHVGTQLSSWETATYPLHDELWDPIWVEHPSGRLVDVVALPINPPPNVRIYPASLDGAGVDLAVWPGSTVFIIGFQGRMASVGKLPVWKTGHVASDLDVDYDSRPMFLIDATTKSGMSGAPVFARQSPVFLTHDGTTHAGTRTRFMRIYSGHFHEQDIGRVWKPKAIAELIANAPAAK